jgi:mRNA interferase MazF
MIQRGDVYFVDLDPVHGREQGGRRPVVVVSSDDLNDLDLVITVVPGTDARNARRDYSTNVRVSRHESGLPLDTIFLCYQVRAIDRARFLEPGRDAPRAAGRIPPARMAEVDAALRRCLEL